MKVRTFLVLLCLLSVAFGCLRVLPRFWKHDEEEEGQYNSKLYPNGGYSEFINGEVYDLEVVKAMCDEVYDSYHRKYGK